MKTSIKSLAAVIALTAFVAGPAAAMVSPSDVNRDIASAVGSGTNITTNVVGDTVFLNGYFADAGDKANAISAAMSTAGVEHVISNAFQSN